MSYKGKGRQKDGVPRARSVNSKPAAPQTRTHSKASVVGPTAPLTSSSSAVHKTTSEGSLVNGMRKLHINSGKNTRTRTTTLASKECRTLPDVAQYILDRKAKNIVVMAGAGISTASGIPDFRTPGTGLYDNLQQYKVPQPEAIFDIDYFTSYPRPFYTLAREIYPDGRYQPNYVHYFLRLLHEKGLLLRLYTQNIDGLERLAGIPAQKLVEAHGNFLSVSCIKCKQKGDTDDIKNKIFADKIPRCNKNGCLGLIKPDIVFFGEDLPRRFYYYLKDFPQADLLLVLGTSLEVEPFAGIVDSVRFYIPRLLFNRQAIGPFKRKKRMNDVVAEGDLIEQLRHFVDMLGWKKDMDGLLPAKVKVEDPEESTESKESSETKDTTASETSSDKSSSEAKPKAEPKKTDAKPATNNTKLTKRQMMSKPPLLKRNSDITAMNHMIRANNTNNVRLLSRPMNGRAGRTTAPLPRIRQGPVPFHAQRTMSRTNNSTVLPSSDQSSSGSSEDSDSDDE